MREGGREGGRETLAVARVIFTSWMMSFHGNHHFSTFLHFWNEFMQPLLHGVDFHVVDVRYVVIGIMIMLSMATACIGIV